MVSQGVHEGINLFKQDVSTEDQRASGSLLIFSRLTSITGDSHMPRYAIQALSKIIRDNISGSRGINLLKSRLYKKSGDRYCSGFAKTGRLDIL
jgi:hypothetical protein